MRTCNFHCEVDASAIWRYPSISYAKVRGLVVIAAHVHGKVSPDKILGYSETNFLPHCVRTAVLHPKGMNFEAYFLSFARLARRSVLFWGHAVTSGVSAFDTLLSRNGGTRDLAHRTGEGGGGDFVGSSEIGEDLGDATPGRAGGAAPDPHRVGGIDYFVSSWLFEDRGLGRLAQRKYSER